MKSWRNWIDWFRDTLSRLLRDGAPSEPLPEGVSPLRVRLLFIVTIALTPIAVVSILQGMDRAQRDATDVHERLIETARAAASREGNMIAASEQIVRAVANLPDVRAASKDCNRALIGAVRSSRYIVNLTRIDENGKVLCAALPQAVGLDVSDRPIFQAVIGSFGQYITVGPARSTILPVTVIGGMVPLRDADGKFEGAVGIAINLEWLKDLLRIRQLPQGAIAGVFDKRGHLIAANDAAVAAAIFSGARQSDSNALQGATDASGRKWVFAETPLLNDEVYVGFAMREATLFAPTYVHVTTDFLMPVLMIGLAWLAIWFGTDRLVTRWIMYLKRISGAYRAGHYTIRPSLEGAPGEFQLLGEALSDMASAIQDRDRKLREAVSQKTELIREVHHRVKNNLQIVMSLLSLQTAQLKDPVARGALSQAQMRINALALVHRMLHEIEDQTTIDLNRLLGDLARQIGDGLGSGRENVRIALEMTPCSVSAEIAIPLALFAVEALTNAYKYAFPDPQRQGVVTIRLRNTGEDLVLSIADNGVGYDTTVVKRSIGSRLIATFGQQVGGISSVRSESGKGTTVEIRFPEPEPILDVDLIAAR
jgi:two-component sensor histidine kinase